MRIKNGFKIREIAGSQIVTGEGVEQIDFNKLISLNESAAFLWHKIEDIDFDIDYISSLIVSHYNVNKEVADNDAKDITNDWIKAGLIDK